MKSAAISISIQTKTSADSIVAAWRNNQLFTASWTNIRILDAKEIDKPKEINPSAGKATIPPGR